MNIQKLEAVLEEMRVATSAGADSPAEQVQGWADRIGDAVTEHLLAELGGPATPAAIAPELATDPGGHDWDESRR